MDLLHELFGEVMADDATEVSTADLTRIETSELQARFQPFSARELVDDVAAEVAPYVERNQNQLVVHCPNDVGSIESDRDKVRLVLAKLLENASLNTDAGRIDLVVSRIERDGLGYLDFRVADTGIGMAPDEVEKLFHVGNGLELAIARCFCLIMGGDMFVESSPGAGTTFDVQLPVTPPGAVLDDPPIPAVAAQGPRVNA